jgi:hypothetical protein
MRCRLGTVHGDAVTVGRLASEEIDPHGLPGAAGEADGPGAGAGADCASAGLPSAKKPAKTAASAIARDGDVIPGASTIRSDHPFGGWRRRFARPYALKVMLLEIGIVVLSIACFVVLELYVLGCERV